MAEAGEQSSDAGSAPEGTRAAGGPGPTGVPRARRRPLRRAESIPDLPPIPGYRLEGVLGEGATGTVYSAIQEAVDRPVAIKLLHPEQCTNRRTVERLKREARITARVGHPGIVSAIDMGESEGRWWYAMELVEGISLAERLAERGPLREREALRLFVPLIEALGHCHENGVVHRDIKPSNILLDERGRARLVDLGLAWGEADPRVTGDAGALGTPHYMSPEQARDAARVDARADLWSIGATLYHAVTGRAPFSGSSAAEVLAGVLHQRIPDPQSLAPGLSKGLALVLRKCLTRDVEQRYQTALELVKDLERLRERRAPHVDARALDPMLGGRDSRRLGVLALFLLLLVAAAGWIRPFSTRRAEPAPQAERSWGALEALEDEARRGQLRFADIDQGLELLLGGALPGEPPADALQRTAALRREGDRLLLAAASRVERQVTEAVEVALLGQEWGLAMDWATTRGEAALEEATGLPVEEALARWTLLDPAAIPRWRSRASSVESAREASLEAALQVEVERMDRAVAAAVADPSDGGALVRALEASRAGLSSGSEPAVAALGPELEGLHVARMQALREETLRELRLAHLEGELAGVRAAEDWETDLEAVLVAGGDLSVEELEEGHARGTARLVPREVPLPEGWARPALAAWDQARDRLVDLLVARAAQQEAEESRHGWTELRQAAAGRDLPGARRILDALEAAGAVPEDRVSIADLRTELLACQGILESAQAALPSTGELELRGELVPGRLLSDETESSSLTWVSSLGSHSAFTTRGDAAGAGVFLLSGSELLRLAAGAVPRLAEDLGWPDWQLRSVFELHCGRPSQGALLLPPDAPEDLRARLRVARAREELERAEFDLTPRPLEGPVVVPATVQRLLGSEDWRGLPWREGSTQPPNHPQGWSFDLRRGVPASWDARLWRADAGGLALRSALPGPAAFEDLSTAASVRLVEFDRSSRHRLRLRFALREPFTPGGRILLSLAERHVLFDQTGEIPLVAVLAGDVHEALTSWGGREASGWAHAEFDGFPRTQDVEVTMTLVGEGLKVEDLEWALLPGGREETSALGGPPVRHPVPLRGRQAAAKSPAPAVLAIRSMAPLALLEAELLRLR